MLVASALWTLKSASGASVSGSISVKLSSGGDPGDMSMAPPESESPETGGEGEGRGPRGISQGSGTVSSWETMARRQGEKSVISL